MTRLMGSTSIALSGWLLLALHIPAFGQASNIPESSVPATPVQRPIESQPNAKPNAKPVVGEGRGPNMPIAPSGPNGAIGDFQPVLHARAVNVNTCMDNLVSQSALTIDRPHKAISSWVTAAPNEHGFNSIVGMNYPNRIAPNGLAVIFAVPKDQKSCEGQSVQVFPTSQTCTMVQAAMVKSGRTLDTIEKMPVIEGRDGTRNVLMPSAGGGCVVVSVKLH